MLVVKKIFFMYVFLRYRSQLYRFQPSDVIFINSVYQVSSIVLLKRNTKGIGKAILRINASGLQKLEDTK